jgi:hypothetical protein
VSKLSSAHPLKWYLTDNIDQMPLQDLIASIAYLTKKEPTIVAAAIYNSISVFDRFNNGIVRVINTIGWLLGQGKLANYSFD